MADPNRLRKVPTFNPQAATPRAMAPSEPTMVTIKAAVDTITTTNGETYESPRVVYDIQDMPIPHDVFVTTPLTSSLVLAIMSGDVEQADEGTGDTRGTDGKRAVGRIPVGRMPAEFGGRLQAKDESAPKSQPAGRQAAPPPRPAPHPAE